MSIGQPCSISGFSGLVLTGYTDDKPVKLGTYRGLEMSVVFDAFSKNHLVSLKGAMTYETCPKTSQNLKRQ